MGFQPLLDLGLSQAQDVLIGIQRGLAATNVQEVQAALGLVQILLVTGGIAQLTKGLSLDQSSGFGIVLLLADDLLHRMYLLSRKCEPGHYTHLAENVKTFPVFTSENPLFYMIARIKSL